MKGKITIVLLGLALAFGMIAASCDNGAYPTLDAKDTSTQFAYDGTDGSGLPKLKADQTPEPPITGQALFDMLAQYENRPIPGGDQNNRVKKYMLTKVAAPATSDDLTTTELKKLYAGLPLIVLAP
jgi:hypothetical protein